MRRHSPHWIIAAFVAFVFVGPAENSVAQESSDGDGASQTPVVLDYTGKLQDQSGTPISGVFQFEFSLYDGPDADEPIWSEKQYLAVIDGSYKVPLGRRTKLSRATLDGDRWIGIQLVDGAQILRDRLSIKESNIDARGGKPGSNIRADTDETEKLIKKARASDSLAFADIARQAKNADNADVAERAKKLGKSMTAKKVRELSEKAIKRLQEHRSNPNAHASAGGKLGDGRQVLDSVGGPGGASYEHTCPPGWVVVGITGGQGRVVDSLALICKPLE